MEPRGILTVDLEDWYHANYESAETPAPPASESRVVEHTEILLELFERHGVRATFFTLGVVADQEAELLATIARAGHEIACHGYGHAQVTALGPDGFRADLRQARRAIEDACGHRPRGFRAPSWSICPPSRGGPPWNADPEAAWPLEILADEGFTYDASLFPFRTYLYGVDGAPTIPHRVQLPSGRSLVELPASVATVGGRPWPFSGGFYFRFLPLAVTRFLCRRYTRQHRCPFMYYIHPREVTTDQPRLDLGVKESFIHYFNLKANQRKLDQLLGRFRFTSAADFLSRAGDCLVEIGPGSRPAESAA